MEAGCGEAVNGKPGDPSRRGAAGLGLRRPQRGVRSGRGGNCSAEAADGHPSARGTPVTPGDSHHPGAGHSWRVLLDKVKKGPETCFLEV